MRRIDFLPAFFTILGIAFAIAVFVRIRTYESMDEAAGSSREATATAAPADERANRTPQRSPDASVAGTLVEIEPRAATVRNQSRIGSLTAAPSATPSSSIDIPPILMMEPVESRSPSAAVASAPLPRSATRAEIPERARTPTPASASSPSRSAAEPAPRSQGVEPPEPARERDESSDTTPPQMRTVEFIPAQIADGETTSLVVNAADNLTGIRTISGTILAPSGAVIGFACQREGTSDRYVARVTIPKEAAEGSWSLNYINLTDNASNANAISAAQAGARGLASFQVVSSRPDADPPTLEAVWLGRRSMHGGEKNTVFVRAYDDKSGVNLVTGIFQSPARVARVGFVCRRGDDASVWSCEMSAPQCADCGEWQLEQLQLQDKANNMATIRSSQNPTVAAVRLAISSDVCDATPPALESIALAQRAVSNSEAGNIDASVRLTDDACGVLSVSGQVVGPATEAASPPRLYFSFTADPDSQTWRGKIAVPRLAAKGTWRVVYLQVLDRGQNHKVYGANDPLLAGAVFQVE